MTSRTLSVPVLPFAIGLIAVLALALLPAAGRAATFNILSQNASELDDAITLSNASPDDEDFIFFEPNLNNLTMQLPTTPTPVDGGLDKVLTLDGSRTTLFLIRPNEDDIGTDDEFVLLHVRTGRAILKDLNISAQGVDPDGDGTDVTGIFQVDAGADIAWDSALECIGAACERDARVVIDRITGEGRLVKLGQQTLVLTGENDWSGGTLIEQGQLRGEPDSLPGDFEILEEGSLALFWDNVNFDSAFSAEVIGEGAFIKDGLGTLVILDDPTDPDDGLAMTGGTEIRQGKLVATTDLIIGDVSIGADGIFELDEDDSSSEYTGDISGQGILRKTGADELRLSGINSFSGGLEIEDGRIVGDTASIPGDVTFESTAATLRFDQMFNGTHTGIISGPGTLEKDGTGTVTLAGSSLHTGGTVVQDGTLRGDVASLNGDITLQQASSGLDFLVNGPQSFGGLIVGPGTLAKSGPGTLVLATTQNYTGDTTIRGGTLQLDVDVVSSPNIIVQSGGTLRNGQTSGLIAGNIVSTGTVDPGARGSLFQVGGTATLTSSTLALSVDDTGAAPYMDVTGNADVDSMKFGIAPEPGLYEPAVRYVVLEANTITGTPDPTPTLDFAFLSVENITVDTSVPGANTLGFDIRSDLSNIDQFAITPNQISTANATEQLLASGTPDSQTILASFSVLTELQVPLVLDQIMGETLSGFTTGRITNAQVFNQMIAQRFNATEYEKGRPARMATLARLPGLPRLGLGLAAATPMVSAEAGPATPNGGVQKPGSLGAWLQPFGIFGDHRGRLNASDITARLYGVTGGIDYRLPQRLALPRSERIRFGLGLGYTRSTLQNDRAGLMKGGGNTVQTALYGGYRGSRLHVGLAGRYAWSSMETERRIIFQAINRTADADFSGHEAGAFAEVGGHFGDPKRVLLHPLASFQYDHLTQGSFLEGGAGDLSLGVNGQSYDSMLLTLGTRISRVFTLESEFGLEPEIRGGYIHEFGDTDRLVRSRFWPVPGSTPFVTAGAPADASTGWVGGGFVMSVADVPLVSLAYDAYIGENVTRHVVAVGLLMRW